MPTFSDLKEIYLLRGEIFTIRFFSLFFAIALELTYIIPTFGLLSKLSFISILFIGLSFLFSIYWIRFKQKIKYVNNKISKGKFLIAYQTLNKLQNESLWASEEIDLKLHQAMLFYQVGNIKRFLIIMDYLSKNIYKNPNQKYFYRLLNHFQYEIKNDFINAKIELEYIIENTHDNHIKAQANNNIGRIEKLQNKYVSA